MYAGGHYITQTLHRALREQPDRLATVHGERRQSWRELGDRVRRVAGLLVSLGVEPGDRVAMLTFNSDRFLEYYFGTFWAGAVINPVNIRWSAEEIAYSLMDCESRVLIVDRHHAPMIADIVKAAPCVRTILTIDIADSGHIDYESAVAAAEPIEERLRSGDDLAALLYTGGTTGRPKGVMLSHRSILASAMGVTSTRDCGTDDSMLHVAPLFHVGGLSGLMTSLIRRARHVFLPSFVPASLLETIEKERVTDVFLVPTMIQMMIDHPDFARRDLSSLNRIFYGASPITPTLLGRVRQQLPGRKFVQAYGMTELSPVATLLLPEEHCPESVENGRILSAGRASMSAQIRVVDPEDRDVPDGEVGEIIVRGEIMMLGYWNRPEETAAALRGGWMHTGDVGRFDADGYLYIVDRLKDMIVTGGENVYSVEVEGALASHPAIAQAGVIGLPCPRWGETVHAVIVLKPDSNVDEAVLADHCRARIAGYKVPRSFEFRDALPLSAAGKVLKKELRQQALER